MKLIFLSCLLFAGIAVRSQSQKQLTVHFEYNKFDLTPAARSSLDSLLQAVPTESIQNISLFGHCDSVGNNLYNDQLSLNRVSTVKNYLENNHIATGIFREEKGFGKRQPLNTNSTEEERYLNRRVEITIVKTEEKPIEKKVEAVITPPVKIEKSLKENIQDTATKIGTKIILKNMNFIGGRHVLLPQSVPILLELLETLKDNPGLEIEIDGHICCTFGAEDGIDLDTRTANLSVNRAMAIYEYLIGHGIKKKRLSFKGFGHSMPLVYPEETEDKRTTNRRVEIKIIKK